MEVIRTKAPTAPISDVLTDDQGRLSRVWHSFFSRISDALAYLGQEKIFPLVNNQGSAASITDLKFDFKYTSAAFVEYLIQRVTTTTVKLQAGIKMAVYNPDTGAWTLAEYGTSGPDAAGITFSITTLGQVQYTSSNLGGTEEISRIVFRVRPLAGKSSIYSRVG